MYREIGYMLNINSYWQMFLSGRAVCCDKTNLTPLNKMIPVSRTLLRWSLGYTLGGPIIHSSDRAHNITTPAI